jgi:hypothetical protein
MLGVHRVLHGMSLNAPTVRMTFGIEKTMTKDRLISVVIYGVFFAALAGFLLLPKPYSTYARTFWVFWLAAMGGYGYSLKSRKPKLELMRNAVTVAVVIAGFAMLFYNTASQGGYSYPIDDPSDYRTDEYSDHSFEETCVMGVLLFVKVALGAAFGVWAALSFTTNATESDD